MRWFFFLGVGMRKRIICIRRSWKGGREGGWLGLCCVFFGWGGRRGGMLLMFCGKNGIGCGKWLRRGVGFLFVGVLLDLGGVLGRFGGGFGRRSWDRGGRERERSGWRGLREMGGMFVMFIEGLFFVVILCIVGV